MRTIAELKLRRIKAFNNISNMLRVQVKASLEVCVDLEEELNNIEDNICEIVKKLKE